jgi:hypothetical protein
MVEDGSSQWQRGQWGYLGFLVDKWRILFLFAHCEELVSKNSGKNDSGPEILAVD